MPRMSRPEVVKGERKSKSFGQRDIDMPSTGIKLKRHLACNLLTGLVDVRMIPKMAGCADCIRGSLHSFVLRLYWQRNSELRSLARLTFNCDASLVFLDDVVTDG